MMNNLLKRQSPTSRKVEGSLEVAKTLKKDTEGHWRIPTEIQVKSSEISTIWKGKLAHLPLSYILRFQNQKMCTFIQKCDTNEWIITNLRKKKKIERYQSVQIHFLWNDTA